MQEQSITQLTVSPPEQGNLVSIEPKNAIEVHNLVKRYPKATTNAVDGVSFSVQQREIFGLLGPNGAGKTTIIGILTTRIRPTGGTAHILDIDVATNPVRVRQHIALLPQHSNLDKRLHARELLTFHASYHAAPRKEREARADTLLAQLGLSERGKDSVQHFSGGMAQRLMLARALMHMPAVLFLDEPTTSLDPQSRLFLWDQIRTLQRQGVTVMLTTHDMDEAEQLCDRIAILDRGQVLVLDTPANLKKLVPGGTKLELGIFLPALITDTGYHAHEATPLSERMLHTLRTLPDVSKVEEIAPTTDEEKQQAFASYRLYADDAETLAVSAMQTIINAGATLRDLRISHPSLEDVFIYLTGRNLRS